METLEPILAEHPLFSGMDQRYLQILVGCARNVRFESTDVIFREGEKANEFYLIRSGKVALQLFADRRGPLTILTLGEGDVSGLVMALSPLSLEVYGVRTRNHTRNFLGWEMPAGKSRTRPRLGLRTPETFCSGH